MALAEAAAAMVAQLALVDARAAEEQIREPPLPEHAIGLGQARDLGGHVQLRDLGQLPRGGRDQRGDRRVAGPGDVDIGLGQAAGFGGIARRLAGRVRLRGHRAGDALQAVVEAEHAVEHCEVLLRHFGRALGIADAPGDGRDLGVEA
nr:hypothetical protein [Mangrovicoccus sp. HB161399]